MLTKSDFNVGDEVFFGRNSGEQTRGEIVKLNGKSAKVRTLEVRGTLKVRAAGGEWRVPYSLLTPAGGAPVAVKRPDSEVIADLQRVECNLSPENLHCDGEISRAAAARKGRALNAERRALVKELGREPTSNELWGR
jgi:hypothetical protein